MRGPFSSRSAYESGMKGVAAAFPLSSILSWTDTASLPLLPTPDSFGTFSRLREAPRLDHDSGTWRVQPHAEFHPTHDKKQNGGVIEFPAGPQAGYWPVFSGESFDIWTPDTKRYDGWAEARAGQDRLYHKRLGSGNRSTSAFAGLTEGELANRDTLPCFRPRIAFRNVSRATDSRTMRAALVPGKVFLSDKAPFFVWSKGDEKDQSYLLGILCSLPLDWYARRFVELAMSFFVINPFPVPRPPRSDKRWQRVVELAGRLAAVDNRYEDWAKAVGVQCGPLDPSTKGALILELDAVVAHLYHLTREQLIQIFETFHEGWDYHSRMNSTLQMFDAWTRKP